jgi:HAD superfamily hydrolase (TIGR01509 family)
MGKMSFQCVIYDCDGVLFDSLESNRRLYNDFCLHFSRPPLTEEELKFVHTHTVFEALHAILGHDAQQEKAAFDFWERIDILPYLDLLQMEPHLLETLDSLKGLGVLRAICTSRSTTMKPIMEKFHLEPHFEMVVTALDVKNPNPHPEAIEKIIAAFGLDRRKMILVGDSANDQQAAQAAGILFAAYKNKEIAGDFFIEDHRLIVDLLSVSSSHGRRSAKAT